jgi:hypothetical protein
MPNYYKIPPFEEEPKPKEELDEERNEKELSKLKFVIIDKSKYQEF